MNPFDLLEMVQKHRNDVKKAYFRGFTCATMVIGEKMTLKRILKRRF